MNPEDYNSSFKADVFAGKITNAPGWPGDEASNVYDPPLPPVQEGVPGAPQPDAMEELQARAYERGVKDAMGDRDYQDENRRVQALDFAIKYYLHGGKEPLKIVECAKVFHNFLRGAE